RPFCARHAAGAPSGVSSTSPRAWPGLPSPVGPRTNPARIVSLAPGIIDTDMQADVRGSDASEFPDIARFKEYKATGQLVAPKDRAVRLLAKAGLDPFARASITATWERVPWLMCGPTENY